MALETTVKIAINDDNAIRRVMTLMSIPGRSREESQVTAFVREQPIVESQMGVKTAI
jgi:hypothetical protein